MFIEIYGKQQLLFTMLKIQVEQADICVLEEPEHLNWYRRPGER